MIASELLPDAIPLRLERVAFSEALVEIDIVCDQLQATCPGCGRLATRCHSRYRRTLADLPWANRRVQLKVQVRRFFCDFSDCPRRTFVERLTGLAGRHARRSDRLAVIQSQVGLAVGGEGGARLSSRLHLPASADTVLRLIRRLPDHPPSSPRVLGIDDWAFRKGRRYGTLLVDLERGRVVDLLPDREPQTLIAWLQLHPGIEIITRDRAQAYIDAATQGTPQAQQVADRFHLLANLREALERFFDRHPVELRKVKFVSEPAPASVAVETTANPPVTPVKLKRRPLKANGQILAQRAGRRAQRQARLDDVLALFQQGISQRQIARRLNLARRTVHRWIMARELPTHRPPATISTVSPWGDYLRSRWQAGCHSPRQLWHEIQSQGYAGSEQAVWRWLLHLREDEAAHEPVLDVRPRLTLTGRAYSLKSRQAAWILCRPIASLKLEERSWLDQMQAVFPLVEVGHSLAQRYITMMKARQAEPLTDWLQAAEASGLRELRNFALSLRGDEQAVRQALTSPWSNGPTEGHVNRLKLIKRMMFGRAKFDLLRQRVLHVS